MVSAFCPSLFASWIDRCRVIGLADLLNPIPGASYNRKQSIAPPDSVCTPGTRGSTLSEITTWGTSKPGRGRPRPHIYRLHGSIGSGKSAIAQTVAEDFAKRKMLGGSFFYWGGDYRRNSIAKSVATLAYDLGASVPQVVPLIEAMVKTQPGLLTEDASVASQLQKLVLFPLKQAFKNRLARFFSNPFLIILDGLDQCEDREAVYEFIDTLASFFKENPKLPLRFLITSRSDDRLESRLDPSDALIVNLDDRSPADDIPVMMRAAFKHAAEHDLVVRSFGPWPTEEEFNACVKHAKGSLGAAGRMMRYIVTTGSTDVTTPMDRLPLALDMDFTLEDSCPAAPTVVIPKFESTTVAGETRVIYTLNDGECNVVIPSSQDAENPLCRSGDPGVIKQDSEV